MVKAPPNHNSLKDDSVQQINNGDKGRLNINCTESTRQGKVGGGGGQEGGGGGGGILTYLSDEIRHLFLTGASQIQTKDQILSDVSAMILLYN